MNSDSNIKLSLLSEHAPPSLTVIVKKCAKHFMHVSAFISRKISSSNYKMTCLLIYFLKHKVVTFLHILLMWDIAIKYLKCYHYLSSKKIGISLNSVKETSIK